MNIRKFSRLPLLQLVFIGLVLQTACIPESDIQNVVTTEDVLYISGEKVRLIGRVIEADGSIDEHGFYIAKDADFTSPITISLGPKPNGLGRFIGEYTSLEINTNYYYRSFANINGQEVTGQIKEFSSLKPSLEYFYPLEGIEGTSLTLKGTNFTEDTEVFIGLTKVNIQRITNESEIVVTVPPITTASEVPVRVTVQDTSMVYDGQFTYYFGRWELEATFFDNTQIYESMFAYENGQFVFGMGKDQDGNLNLNVWGLDLNTMSWSDLNFPGTFGMRAPFTSNGYWGTGLEFKTFTGTTLSPYFWRYNAGNFELKPFLNFRLYKSVGMHLGGDLYVFGGVLSNDFNNMTIHRYQESTDTWSVEGDAPIEIFNEYPYFAFEDKGYFVLPDGVIWQFDPANGWSAYADYPGAIYEGGIAVVSNDKVYIGLSENDGQVWEWDIKNNIWVRKVRFTGSVRDVNIGYFAHNNKIYFFRSKFSDGQYEIDPRMELWSLDPQALN